MGFPDLTFNLPVFSVQAPMSVTEELAQAAAVDSTPIYDEEKPLSPESFNEYALPETEFERTGKIEQQQYFEIRHKAVEASLEKLQGIHLEDTPSRTTIKLFERALNLIIEFEREFPDLIGEEFGLTEHLNNFKALIFHAPIPGHKEYAELYQELLGAEIWNASPEWRSEKFQLVMPTSCSMDNLKSLKRQYLYLFLISNM